MNCSLNGEMRMNKIVRSIIGIGIWGGMFLLTGCATLVEQPTQVLPVVSKPDGAAVQIKDEAGRLVFDGQTPAMPTLQKSNGTYFGKKSYSVTVSKEGYPSQSVLVTAKPNAWYVLGNGAIGGLVGWFIVDPLNGAMYKLSPETVAINFAGEAAVAEDTSNELEGYKVPPQKVDDRSYYLALDVGQSNMQDVCAFSNLNYLGVTVNGSSCTNPVMNFRGGLGFQINDKLALEYGYLNGGESRSSLTGVYGGNSFGFPIGPMTGEMRQKYFEHQFLMIASLPEIKNFSVFGELGVMSWAADIYRRIDPMQPSRLHDGGQGWLFGGGVKYRLNKQWLLRAKFDIRSAGKQLDTNGASSNGTINTMSMGIVYMLGGGK